MATLTDSPEYTADEVYEIQATDPVEGAATDASYGGIGLSNQPHQQLANRTAFLYNQQKTDIANIAALQALLAGFAGSLQQNGYLKIPITDASRGAVTAIIQWGYYPLAQAKLSVDAQYTVVWPIPFPNAILLPPFATNVYYKTGGLNTAASVVSYSATGATFVLDVPGDLESYAQGPEITNGFSWLAIGF